MSCLLWASTVDDNEKDGNSGSKETKRSEGNRQQGSMQESIWLSMMADEIQCGWHLTVNDLTTVNHTPISGSEVS